MSRKKVKYEAFLDFVQKLPARDALIAKLLYFGAPSMDSVLSLKKDAVHAEKSSISFPERDVVFPKHLIKDLCLHMENRKKESDLVFTNVRGAEVEEPISTKALPEPVKKCLPTPGLHPVVCCVLKTKKLKISL